MSNKDVVNMTIQHHIRQEVAIKQLKIKSIHKDIIRLKQENRNLSAKRKGMIKSIKHWIKREGENFDDTRLRNCMEARIRDLDYVDMLVREKVCYNSVLINKHRSKVKSLRSELQELKKELNVLGDIKGEVK